MKKVKLLVIPALLLIITITGGCQKPETSPPLSPPQTDSPVLKPEPQTISPDAKLVCLFFDDGWQNQYDIALPILLQHDFKASFGIITDSIGTGEGFWEYIDEKEINELAKYGMDIAAHTITHPRLTEVTDDQLHQEIFDSKKHLEDLGHNVRTIIYPNCVCNEKVISYVKDAGYVCGRICGWDGDTYDLKVTDADARYRIYSDPIVNHDFDQFKTIADKASRDKVVCLCYHFISDTGPEETSTPVANFVAQMRYLKESGFTIVLLPDLVEYSH